MTQEIINVGTAPNDGTGDSIREGFTKTNDNFDELYSRVQLSPPATSIGTIGDSPGMIAYASGYFYICTGDYDGSTAIWRRAAIATW